MTPTVRANILKAYHKRMSVGDIARVYGYQRSLVQRALIGENLRPSEALRREDIRQRAIAELLADGCDPAVVAANFGSEE